MKTQSKKLLAVLTLAFSMNVLATDLPVIPKPADLSGGDYSEGTITHVSPADINNFIPWAQNARKALLDALEQSHRLPREQRIDFLISEMKAVVDASGAKQYQSLMRFSLNRGLLLVDVLRAEANCRDFGIMQNQIDILNRAINQAILAYESDMKFQQHATEMDASPDIDYVKFGSMISFSFLESAKNIFDVSAQYQVMRKVFEMLDWDLSQDKDAKLYAESIVEIYRVLQRIPVRPNEVVAASIIRDHLNNLTQRMFKSINEVSAHTGRGTMDGVNTETGRALIFKGGRQGK